MDDRTGQSWWVPSIDRDSYFVIVGPSVPCMDKNHDIVDGLVYHPIVLFHSASGEQTPGLFNSERTDQPWESDPTFERIV